MIEHTTTSCIDASRPARTRHARCSAWLGAASALLTAAPLAAATITVPTDQPTIQAAIDAATNGDLIICLAGTFAERVDLSGKSVELRGQGAGVSIIDATGLGGSAVTAASGEGPGAIITGFTITGGTGTNVEVAPGQFLLVGGGLYVNGSSPTITSCLITANSAGDGAGMYVWSGSPDVSDCTFSGNASTDDGGGALVRGGAPAFDGCSFSGNTSGDKGAGVYTAASTATITGCSFSGNTATGDGGGMYNLQGSAPTVEDCTFSGNSTGFDGGGMHNTGGSDAVVRRCRFEGNTAGDDGGGMFGSSSSPLVEATTFEANAAIDDGGGMMNVGGSPVLRGCVFALNSSGDEGGAVRNDGSNATLLNCSLSENDADDAGGGLHNIGGSAVTVTNSILWQNSAMVVPEVFNSGSTCTIAYSTVEGSGGSGAGWNAALGADGGGNVAMSPLFVDRGAGDLRVRAGSPCIDAADGSAVPAGMTEDRDGQPRFRDDPGTADTGVAGGSPAIDMGAFEFQLESYNDGDLVGELDLDAFGAAVARVGDINGDEVDDFVVGAPNWNGKRGRVYVFSGLDNGLIWKKAGIATGDRFGLSVASAGNVDGDGVPDLVVGSPFHDDGADTDAGRIDVLSGADGSRLYGKKGKNARDRLGWAVAGGIDVNNDGRDDFLAGAPMADGNGGNSGEVRVYSGANGQQLRRIKGRAAGDRFGWSVAALGNVDGDAFGDFAAAAPWNDLAGGNAGEVTVYAGGTYQVIFRRRGQGSPDRFGYAIGHGGDADADGRADLVVGAPNRRRNGVANTGRVYVYSGATGVRLFIRTGQGGSRLGIAVGTAGDVDCDGRDDILMGADRFDGAAGADAGRVQVCSGLDGSILQTIDGAGPGDRLGRATGVVHDLGAAATDLLAGSPKGGSGDEGAVIVEPAIDCVAAAMHAPAWPTATLSADLDADGVVGPTDLLVVLRNLGTVATADPWGGSNGDLDRSGLVDAVDLLVAIDQLGARDDEEP